MADKLASMFDELAEVAISSRACVLFEHHRMGPSAISLDGPGLCGFNTAVDHPFAFAGEFKKRFLRGNCYPSFRFVSKKSKKKKLPDEAFFFPYGCFGACPAIRVKRCVEEKTKERIVTLSLRKQGFVGTKDTTVLVDSKENLITLSIEAGIINITKKTTFELNLMIPLSEQKTWANEALKKALCSFIKKGHSELDFENFGSFKIDDDKKLRLAILLHHMTWIENKDTWDIRAATLAEYDLRVQRPDPKKKRDKGDDLNLDRGHLSATVKRMEIVDMNDKAQAAAMSPKFTELDFTKKTLPTTILVKWKPAELITPAKQSKSKKETVKSSKTKKRPKSVKKPSPPKVKEK